MSSLRGPVDKGPLLSKSVLIYSILSLLSYSSNAFNLDVHAPIYKYGPNGTYFGYTVAQHYQVDTPVILVGAPRADSGQVGTIQAGALYSCPINTNQRVGGKQWCEQIRSEYLKEDVGRAYAKPPNETQSMGKAVHPLGKDYELLGASLASQGKPNGKAVVCAPLMRFHQTSAYAQGSCYELKSDLTLDGMTTTCMQKNLPKEDRHNEYGACMEGFSVGMTENTLLTGLIGAMKWTGGVFARRSEGGIFDVATEKYTMASTANVRSLLTAHDYLGYSVDMGRFGFWHEGGEKRTVVSGATRFGQHGAVFFLPFSKDKNTDHLTFTEDVFKINGSHLGSAFGYDIQVVDLNNDGFDDLIIGAPFEHRSDKSGHFGGVVYVYFSQGVERKERESHLVFHTPIILKSPGFFSQFGLSIASLGNLDGDKDKLNDFAVGAPYAFDGAGAVYIYHGSKNWKKFRTSPAQIIKATDLPSLEGAPLRSFGFSLSGGVDVDGNGYPDLAVGAVTRGVVTIIRSRPVISIKANHSTPKPAIDIEKGNNCPGGANTCFPLSLDIFVDGEKNKGDTVVNFNSNVFLCNLEVLPLNQGVQTRALIEGSKTTNYSWPCGQNANKQKQSFTQNIYIPSNDNAVKDWLNPLKFKFTVRIKDERNPRQASEGQPAVDLRQYPILNKFGASYEFTVPFNTLCGKDAVCQADLVLKAVFVDIPKTENGYLMNVGDKDHLSITMTVENQKEKAYQAALFLTYDPEELELPTVKIHGKSKITMETVGKNVVQVFLGNPMDSKTTHQFDVQFKLVRGRTEGIGRPLRFHALVNSTSQEANIANNNWEAEVRIIKKAELRLIGISDPQLVRFGGDVLAESQIDLEEDIGPIVRHNYTVHNEGPWTVRNVNVKIDWPYQVSASYKQGKWALYLLDVPTITTYNTDGTTEIRKCTVPERHLYINPNDRIKVNTKYQEQETVPRIDHNKRRMKRDTEEATPLGPEATNLKIAKANWDRLRSKKQKDQHGSEVEVVTMNCLDGSAKCFSVICHFDFIDANSAPVIDFRARLWNSTFIEDYWSVEYVEISSVGRIELDSTQGIEDDPNNNDLVIKTHAYPDRPSIAGDGRPLDWWIIPVSILVGILILLIIVFICYRCGFFKRNRVDHPSLHTAQLRHEREQWNT